MCPTNDEQATSDSKGIVQQRVCRSEIEHLRIPGTHISFAPGCKRRMWQHVIRFNLSPASAGFKEWDKISSDLYLVRPDGSSWNTGWDSVVHRKVQNALARCASEAVRLGLVRELDGDRVWQDWTKGFLTPEWDGSCFDEKYARSLLEQKADKKDNERRQLHRYEAEITALTAQVQGLGQTPVVPPRQNEGEELGRRQPAPAAQHDHDVDWNANDDDNILPGDSVTRIIVSSGGIFPPQPRPVPVEAHASALVAAPSLASLPLRNSRDNNAAVVHSVHGVSPTPNSLDVAQFWTRKSLAELEAMLRQGWARLFDLRILMFEARFPREVDEWHDRQANRLSIITIRKARERLLEEIFFIEDIIDGRRQPPGSYPTPYPASGMLWKYFLGGDLPSQVMENRSLGARRHFL
ncbi:uncharacterized protein CTRU02_215797 [Colletotrichum truncatum]|uniref:Uncharacterized protein n=1 Tax=Colletotrichum truncatum TaxID=5467 RepID=A0ACC3YBP2_COLTU|nr:uncharacterized protein CTRU02_15082 [Colletotrichum truncatum]KAF6781442.1 hypothetical protein CTRU02_15082 [Colletotrichum truncatum]